MGQLTTFSPPGNGQLFDIRSLSWSPDGSRIAFGAAVGDPDDAIGDLYVMHADGSLLARLSGGDPPLGNNGETGVPAWSPEGSKIAFDALTIATEDGAFVSSQRASANAFVVSHQIPATACGANPSWSPNGARIAYSCIPFHNPSLGTGIFTIRPDGTGATQVTTFGNSPLWRPGKQ